MGTDLVQADRIIEQNDVVEEYLMGYSLKQISDRRGIPYTRVKSHVEEWRQFAQNHPAVKARAKEALVGADEHYQRIIRNLWGTINDVDLDDSSTASTMARAKTGALKALADIEAKRVEMLHRAGLLENDELTEQLVETERKQEILVGILRDVSSECEHCRPEVARRLSAVTEEVEVTQVNVKP